MMKPYELIARIEEGAYRGSYLAHDPETGEKLRVRVYPLDDEFRVLVDSVLAERRWVPQQQYFKSPEWLVVVTPYEAWWPLREMCQLKTRRARLIQPRSAVATAIGRLGLWIADRMDQNLPIPLIYPDNIIVSASGMPGFWHYSPPTNGLFPKSYHRYMAPEEMLDGSRSIQTILFNLGATLYEMVEGRPLTSGKIDDPVSEVLTARPFGRWFKSLVSNPYQWLGRSPEVRGTNLRAQCDQLMEHFQMLIELADEPKVDIAPSRLCVEWLQAHDPEIRALLRPELDGLLTWSKPIVRTETQEYWKLLHRIDSTAIAESKHLNGQRLVIGHHVDYKELTTEALITYLQAWQDLFKSYQTLTGMRRSHLRIVEFHTEHSFRACSEVPLDADTPPMPIPPTAGLLGLKKVVTSIQPNKLSKRQRHAVERAIKAIESAQSVLPDEQLSLEAFGQVQVNLK